MGKVKNLLAILLTAVLLIGGSLLPVAATRFQDKTTTNVVQYENIEALQLRLEEEALSLTYQEKIFLTISTRCHFRKLLIKLQTRSLVKT